MSDKWIVYSANSVMSAALDDCARGEAATDRPVERRADKHSTPAGRYHTGQTQTVHLLPLHHGDTV